MYSVERLCFKSERKIIQQAREVNGNTLPRYARRDVTYGVAEKYRGFFCFFLQIVLCQFEADFSLIEMSTIVALSSF